VAEGGGRKEKKTQTEKKISSPGKERALGSFMEWCWKLLEGKGQAEGFGQKALEGQSGGRREAKGDRKEKDSLGLDQETSDAVTKEENE